MTTSPRLWVRTVIEVSNSTHDSESYWRPNLCLDQVPLSARNLPASFWDCNWVGSPGLVPGSGELGGYSEWADPWHNYMAAQMAVSGGSYSAHQMYHNARSGEYSAVLTAYMIYNFTQKLLFPLTTLQERVGGAELFQLCIFFYDRWFYFLYILFTYYETENNSINNADYNSIESLSWFVMIVLTIKMNRNYN